MISSNRSFQAHRLLRSAHAQTIWPLLGRAAVLDNRPERLELEDGDFLDLNWFEGGGKTVLVMHGLEGSLHSHYIIAIMNALKLAGFTGVLMHFRGCSEAMNRLPRFYHSGDTADFSAVIAHIERVTARRVYAGIGFSLGGNVLLKYLGQASDCSGLQKAVAVSTPFDLAACAMKLSQGSSRGYQHYLLSRLKAKYRKKFATMESPINPKLDELATFFDYDDAITAPLHGFKGVDDYYQHASCKPYIADIQTQTLIVHAQDDPFVAVQSIPSITPSPVKLALSPRGGHVGFVGGHYRTNSWLPARILHFLQTK